MFSKREDIAEKIYALGVLQQNFVMERLKKLQLNSLQARSLSYIAMHPGTMQRELAAYLGKQQASVTNILKVLEERGYIYRESNERQKNLYLTTLGEVMVAKVQAIFQELGGKTDEIFTTGEREQLVKLLVRLEDQLL
ncbi:MAG: MarR family winged helix-turn-helix transcriptional regulator [Enterococcus sp.]